jgi:hypothetical protein
MGMANNHAAADANTTPKTCGVSVSSARSRRVPRVLHAPAQTRMTTIAAKLPLLSPPCEQGEEDAAGETIMPRRANANNNTVLEFIIVIINSVD